ncbi:MAG TPA: hypothetical protein DCM08_02270 [Microscillaceae bacterium]|nr:hypothetical protein [Microscillaceae bacterium]
MSENKYRQKGSGENRLSSEKRGFSVTEFFENFAGVEAMLDKGLPTRFIPYLLFLAFLGLIYIGNAHFAERTIRELNRSETEADNLKADYTTIKVQLLFAGKQTEISAKAQEVGLVENNGKTYRIILKKNE